MHRLPGGVESTFVSRGDDAVTAHFGHAGIHLGVAILHPDNLGVDFAEQLFGLACWTLCDFHAVFLRLPQSRASKPLKSPRFLSSISSVQTAWTDHVQPGENRDIYDKLYKEFVTIYKKNHKIYRRLNS